jgi:RNA-directed DNA polymerase
MFAATLGARTDLRAGCGPRFTDAYSAGWRNALPPTTRQGWTSRKAVRRLLQRVHDATTPYKHAESPGLRFAAINRLLRGWAAYFNQGPVLPTYKLVRWYVERRLQRWLVRRSGQAGTGYRQYPNEYLYETLGLHALPRRRADLPSAKA